MASILSAAFLRVKLRLALLEHVFVGREDLRTALLVVPNLVESRGELGWVLDAVVEGVLSPEAVRDRLVTYNRGGKQGVLRRILPQANRLGTSSVSSEALGSLLKEMLPPQWLVVLFTDLTYDLEARVRVRPLQALLPLFTVIFARLKVLRIDLEAVLSVGLADQLLVRLRIQGAHLILLRSRLMHPLLG